MSKRVARYKQLVMSWRLAGARGWKKNGRKYRVKAKQLRERALLRDSAWFVRHFIFLFLHFMLPLCCCVSRQTFQPLATRHWSYDLNLRHIDSHRSTLEMSRSVSVFYTSTNVMRFKRSLPLHEDEDA